MFRISAADGSTRQSVTVRIGLTVAYTLFALAGLGLVLSPAVALTYGPASLYFSVFMLLGGALAGLGTATGRWVGEFTGLPLLVAAFAAFGLEVLATNYDNSPYLTVSNTVMLWGVATFALARWRVTLATYRMVHALAQNEKAEG